MAALLHIFIVDVVVLALALSNQATMVLPDPGTASGAILLSHPATGRGESGCCCNMYHPTTPDMMCLSGGMLNLSVHAFPPSIIP